MIQSKREFEVDLSNSHSDLEPDMGQDNGIGYQLCGMLLWSSRKLNMLRGAESKVSFRDADFTFVVRGRSSIEEVRAHGDSSSWVRLIGPHRVCLDLPGVGTLDIRPGRIVAGLVDKAQWNELVGYAFGVGLGISMYMKRVAPFHVSAVTWGGSALAITGESGAGKSSMACALARSFGSNIMCDDLARIEALVDGVAQIYHGIGNPRLLKDSVRHLDTPGVPRFRDERGARKYRMLRGGGAGSPRELLALVWIIPGEATRQQSELTRLRGRSRIDAWMQALYALPFGPLVTDWLLVQRVVMRLAERVPVYQLLRSRRIENIEADAKLIAESISMTPVATEEKEVLL